MGTNVPLLGIVGATGAVGLECLSLLAERGHPSDRVVAAASARSVGLRLPYGELETVPVVAADPVQLGDADVVILASSAEVARELAPDLMRRGCRVVDNSSAFRQDPSVPLVIPEVNLPDLARGPGLVANPNCSTILLLVALEPLRQRLGLEQVVVSTYQAASGAGLAAMDELRDQSLAVLQGREPEPRVFPEPCAFNVFPHESPLDGDTGLNGEELKIIRESHRIWGSDKVQLVPTCARVPAVRSHCQSVMVTLAQEASFDEVRQALGSAPGLRIFDEGNGQGSPTSLNATGEDDVLVGRVRRAPGDSSESPGRNRVYCLWLAGDQLRKGAALNALQISDELLRVPKGPR
jgi:aspartate-semialdehyde dehydrogenase